jgi:hypothetical protein
MKLARFSDRFNDMNHEVDMWIKANPGAEIIKVELFGNNIQGNIWLIWYC